MPFLPPLQPPRWFKSPVLGVIEERDANRLWFVPNRAHDALANLPDVHCGLEGEPGTAIAIENAFRHANQTRRDWRQAKKPPPPAPCSAKPPSAPWGQIAKHVSQLGPAQRPEEQPSDTGPDHAPHGKRRQ
jgi:hypothetical protein